MVGDILESPAYTVCILPLCATTTTFPNMLLLPANTTLPFSTFCTFAFDDGALSDDMQKHIHAKATSAGTYSVGIFLSNDAYTGTGAINFTNDNESMKLFDNLGIASDSDFAKKITTDFSIDNNIVKGYTGTLIVQ